MTFWLPNLEGSRCASLGGFSLHANTACEAWERDKLERLCRYVARPALSIDRLRQRPDGLLIYKLKKPYQDGTEYLLFSPQELLEKLAALVPIPRVHLTRYYGCLAPHSMIRSQVVPKKPRQENNPSEKKQAKPSRRRRRWAELIKRIFKVDVETCSQCGGKARVIAAIMDVECGH